MSIYSSYLCCHNWTAYHSIKQNDHVDHLLVSSFNISQTVSFGNSQQTIYHLFRSLMKNVQSIINLNETLLVLHQDDLVQITDEYRRRSYQTKQHTDTTGKHPDKPNTSQKLFLEAGPDSCDNFPWWNYLK